MSIVKKMQNKPEVKVLLELMRLSNTEAYTHSLSVASITEKMLLHTDYSKEEREDIVTGALLHDIGKVFVPLNLTQFPQSLSLQEFNIVKVHASVSYEIVKSVFSKTVQNICLYHHEKPDGSGYMNNITLFYIPAEALLVQVADVYDALTSDRSYKKRYNPEEALRNMKSDAFKFTLDYQYVGLLEKVLKEQREQKED